MKLIERVIIAQQKLSQDNPRLLTSEEKGELVQFSQNVLLVPFFRNSSDEDILYQIDILKKMLAINSTKAWDAFHQAVVIYKTMIPSIKNWVEARERDMAKIIAKGYQE